MPDEEVEVSFLTPEEDLNLRGIYYITGLIEEGFLREIHQNILLKHIDPSWQDDIQLIINSVGGSVSEGNSFIDLLDFIRMDVRTTAMGYCASMGACLACCGSRGKRVITPNTMIMIHGTTWGVDGNRHQISAVSREMERDHDRDVKFWLKHSKYTKREEVERHFLHGHNDEFMNAEEAIKHGIFDGIVGQKKRRRRGKK